MIADHIKNRLFFSLNWWREYYIIMLSQLYRLKVVKWESAANQAYLWKVAVCLFDKGSGSLKHGNINFQSRQKESLQQQRKASDDWEPHTHTPKASMVWYGGPGTAHLPPMQNKQDPLCKQWHTGYDLTLMLQESWQNARRKEDGCGATHCTITAPVNIRGRSWCRGNGALESLCL